MRVRSQAQGNPTEVLPRRTLIWKVLVRKSAVGVDGCSAHITTIISHPPPLSQPRYDMFSGEVHINRPYGALKIRHTGDSVVGVVVVSLVLTIAQ